MEKKNYNSREGGPKIFLSKEPFVMFFYPFHSLQIRSHFQEETKSTVPKHQVSSVGVRENEVCIMEQAANQTTKSVGVRSSIIVSTRQRGNSLLKYLRNVPWEFGNIIPDYVLGETCCALFLSLRYHNLNPEYIHLRLRSLGQSFALRVLLVQVDVKDPHFSLKELAKICILSDCTLILSWSPEEAARYLETYKCYEQKPADVLKERTEKDLMSRMAECLTTVKYVNKTDSCTLFTTFGTLFDLANASREDLSLCPGLGPQKAKRLYDTFHEPFLKTSTMTFQ
uniref:DNA excision repair protein ERCC-1 n=1 Tax=Xenopus tropicalis TaxID=8364 RepID=A0A6I8PLS8_XENTR